MIANIWKVIALLCINSKIIDKNTKELMRSAKIVICNAYKNGFIKIIKRDRNVFLSGICKNWKALIDAADNLY